ncbi:MAG: histidine phosphatase family protein [Candidatus Pacebacteria bacterium]|nr:histidine phosphatase family protein [Candidatus Paceibacterota bacterium]
MKILAVVRHGEYEKRDGDYRLSDYGKRQIAALAGQIKTSLVNGGGKPRMLSSTAPRALDSARVMSEVLGVPFEEHPVLWSGGGGGGYPDCKAVMELIKQDESPDVVILVTHLEYIERFPGHFATSIGAKFDGDEIPKGHAWIIDVEKKSIDHLRCAV